jgi:hypothetical protein
MDCISIEQNENKEKQDEREGKREKKETTIDLEQRNTVRSVSGRMKKSLPCTLLQLLHTMQKL